MPGSECRGGRAFWVPLTAASGEALAPPPTELKNGFVWRLGSGVLCALDSALTPCAVCEMARWEDPCSPGEAARGAPEWPRTLFSGAAFGSAAGGVPFL